MIETNDNLTPATESAPAAEPTPKKGRGISWSWFWTAMIMVLYDGHRQHMFWESLIVVAVAVVIFTCYKAAQEQEENKPDPK